jgi:2',3'-cyclic-nucleotide 2'-phosphodiesterase (5'-nucleotidase family)
VIGTLKFEGKSIKGRQMVDVLNYIGLDYAILGNHEFDLDLPDLQERINESKFKWISTDVTSFENSPFAKKSGDGSFTAFPTSDIITVKGKDENSFKIGLFSATTPIVKKNWITYNDYKTSATSKVAELSKNSDVVLGITHLEISQDRQLASILPTVPLLMGGHDHDNMRVQEGKTVITKADANAKSVYVHRVRMDNKTRKITITSESIAMDENIPEHAGTAALVQKWKNIAIESMNSQGFNPTNVVKKLTTTLDGRESSVRHEQCPLGTMIASSMLDGSREKAICAFFNGGSVRVDDQLTGNLTEYDIIRIMPYGGQVAEVSLKGSLLKKVLDAGNNNKGKGGYLQRTPNIAKVGNDWAINGTLIEDAKPYQIITGAFLFSGKEAGLEFFNEKNPEVIKFSLPNAEDKSDLRNDTRKLFIQYLKK